MTDQPGHLSAVMIMEAERFISISTWDTQEQAEAVPPTRNNAQADLADLFTGAPSASIASTVAHDFSWRFGVPRGQAAERDPAAPAQVSSRPPSLNRVPPTAKPSQINEHCGVRRCAPPRWARLSRGEACPTVPVFTRQPALPPMGAEPDRRQDHDADLSGPFPAGPGAGPRTGSTTRMPADGARFRRRRPRPRRPVSPAGTSSSLCLAKQHAAHGFGLRGVPR